LIKVLTQAGIGSRRRMTAAIKEGRVSVNSEVIDGFNHPVDPQRDEIHLDGRRLNIQPQQFVYLALNKPKGILSTVKDERGRRTVIDLLPEKYKKLRLYPVGRLDKDSTGLILLTNDGDLAHRLTHPAFENEKEYIVRVKGVLRSSQMRQMERGIKLEDGITAPARVKKLSENEYSITIHEGRKRQVRRMFEALGHPVTELKRVRMGKLRMGDLKEGGVREVGRLLQKSKNNHTRIIKWNV